MSALHVIPTDKEINAVHFEATAMERRCRPMAVRGSRYWEATFLTRGCVEAKEKNFRNG